MVDLKKPKLLYLLGWGFAEYVWKLTSPFASYSEALYVAYGSVRVGSSSLFSNWIPKRLGLGAGMAATKAAVRQAAIRTTESIMSEM